MKAYKKMKAVSSTKMPYNVMRFFPDGARQIDFFGDQVSFGEDYGNLEEIRNCINWLADQFGGTVKWKKIDD